MSAVMATAVGWGPAASRPDGGAIAIDSDDKRTSPETAGAWMLYGIVLASAATRTGHGTDYVEELEARKALADRWKGVRAAKHAQDRYLDQLVEVSDAGFIAEYVLVFLARPGWVISGADLAKLRLAAFKEWVPSHLGKEHEPETRARIQLAAGLRPLAVPGDRLPSSHDIDPQRAPCGSLEPGVARALARWDEEEARLGQVAISVMSSDQFPAAFERTALEARARRDGVVLVSARVATAVFVAGFCAVERGAFAEAERYLRRAVALSPGNANIRGELVQTLIVQKKLDAADAELDVALALPTSPCHVAVLWRKRGYVLFDRGKLVDAYKAYARSLEYDPGSEIARKEMRLIVTVLRRAGGYDEKALGPYTPLPPGEMTVTKCK